MAKIHEKEMTVVISNSLIQNRKPDDRNISTKLSYNLDIYQQKIIAILMAHVFKDDNEFKPLALSFHQFCTLSGITCGGKTYDLIWKSLQELSRATFTIRQTVIDNKGKEKHITGIYHWIDTILIHEEEKIVDIKLDDSLKPFLLGLDDTKKYIIYELGCMLSFKKKWSGILYQWLKSHQGHGTIQISINELKSKMMTDINTYKTPRDFIIYVIKPAIDEINKYTDLNVGYEKKTSKPVSGGREKVTGFIFTIRKKSPEQYLQIKDKIWNIDFSTNDKSKV
jgi:plasmid replication initiation protein